MPSPFASPLSQDRPQERLERQGAAALRDAELLALVLRNGTSEHPVEQVAEALLEKAGSLPQLLTWAQSDFVALPGIGPVKAIQLLSVFELSRRLQRQALGERPCLKDPSSVFSFLQTLAQGLTVEKFWVLCLNTRHRLIRSLEVSSGTATASLAHPREVFREAIRVSATAVILAHNHPSGDPQPSAADIGVTRQLREAARILNIELLDHIVVGRPEADPAGRGYYSFRSSGFL